MTAARGQIVAERHVGSWVTSVLVLHDNSVEAFAWDRVAAGH